MRSQLSDDTQGAEVDPAARDAGDARAQFAQALVARLAARNFTSEYLARRCRTTASVVEAWRSGRTVPNHAEWFYLGRLGEEFVALGPEWRAARDAGDAATHPAPDPVVTHPDSAVAYKPADQFKPTVQLDREVEGPLQERIRPAPTSFVSSANHADLRTTFGDGTVVVPDGSVVYRCRITRGRILEIPLPADLSMADVDRLCAFLRTQADDDDPGSSS